MLEVQVTRDELHFGSCMTVRFMRTLRLPEDGNVYLRPRAVGTFPIFSVRDYADRVPASWRVRPGVFIPMYQREAMRIEFSARWWKPNAVKVGFGHINAVTGDSWHEQLSQDPQDYLVCPDQPWLDGIKDGDGFIRQFVALPLDLDYCVESELNGLERHGGVQVMVFESKAGRFPEQPPGLDDANDVMAGMSPADGAGLKIGADARIRQKIYPDAYGCDTWDQRNFGRVVVHIVNSMMFRDITGQEPPSTPISARQYTEAGLPWLELYDEHKADLRGSDKFRNIRSIEDREQE